MDEKKLELYCIDVPVLMSLALTHRFCEGDTSKVVAIIDKPIYERRNMLGVVEKMKQSDIFHDVIEDNLFFDISFQGAMEEYEQYILEYYDKIFARWGYSIENFENIVCLNDDWDGRINLYFNLKKKKYKWIQFDKNRLLEKVGIGKTASSIFVEMMNKYRPLSPFAPYAVPCRLKNCNQSLIDKLPEDTYIFDFEESIKNMPIEIVKKVVNVYGISEICGSVLFIPNSYGYLYYNLSNRVKSMWNEFEYDEWLYYSLRVAADYLLNQNDEFIVKPHPNDPIAEKRLKEIMNEKTQVLSCAPWEWLRRYLLINEIKIPKAIGIASTALDSLDNEICDDKIILEDSFKKTWFFWDAIYIALNICKEIDKPIIANSYLKEQGEKIAEAKFANTEFQFADSKEFEQQIIWIDAVEYAENNLIIKKLNEIRINDVAILFNIDYVEESFEKVKKRYLSCINVKMEGCHEHMIDCGQKNAVWVYSKDENVHNNLQSFHLEDQMFRRNGTLKAHVLNRDEVRDWCERQSQKTELVNLKSSFILQQKRLPKLFWNSANSSMSIVEALKRENDIVVYLDMLQRLKHDYFILMAVKDTPGNCLDEFVIEQLKNIGFRGFSNQLWHMYVGMSLKEEIIIDHAASKREENVEEQIFIRNHKVRMCSQAWRTGNQASIKIDGKEFAINKRGINIVVYDVNQDMVVDSMAYDAHTSNKRFFR